MKSSNASPQRNLKALVVLGAVTAFMACNGKDKTASQESGSVQIAGDIDLSKLRADVASLNIYRDSLVKWTDSLSRSWRHYYYCDSEHKDPKICPSTVTHIPPPPPPPK